MKKILILSFVALTFLGCSSDDDNENQSQCGFDTLISAEQFKNAPSDQLLISDLKIENNCLKISFSSGGCDGSSWELKLIDAGEIQESDPPQRNLRLSLKNEELCLAIVNRELSFDISNLQLEGNRVQLNFANSDQRILYEY